MIGTNPCANPVNGTLANCIELCRIVNALMYISPNSFRLLLRTNPTKLSVLAIMKGDTPKANMERIIFRSSPIYRFSKGREARREKRKLTTHTALHAWESTVAKAAPFTPMSNQKIKIGSRMMFNKAPIRTENMAMAGRPCALIKLFNPVDISTNIVPKR